MTKPSQITEIKAFVPAQDFALSQTFYSELGFTQASEGGGVAYFHRDGCSFLLQGFYLQAHSENFMMHLLVADASAWHEQVKASGVVQKYGVTLGELTEQPWHMWTLYCPIPVVFCGALARTSEVQR